MTNKENKFIHPESLERMTISEALNYLYLAKDGHDEIFESYEDFLITLVKKCFIDPEYVFSESFSENEEEILKHQLSEEEFKEKITEEKINECLYNRKKRNALKDAKERYDKLSTLKKLAMLVKTTTPNNIKDKSIEEIEMLYGGKKK